MVLCFMTIIKSIIAAVDLSNQSPSTSHNINFIIWTNIVFFIIIVFVLGFSFYLDYSPGGLVKKTLISAVL